MSALICYSSSIKEARHILPKSGLDPQIKGTWAGVTATYGYFGTYLCIYCYKSTDLFFYVFVHACTVLLSVSLSLSLSLSLSSHEYADTYMYMYLHTRMYIHMSKKHLGIYLYVICICIYIYMYVCTYIYLYIFLSMYVLYIYIYIVHMHTHTYRSQPLTSSGQELQAKIRRLRGKLGEPAGPKPAPGLPPESTWRFVGVNTEICIYIYIYFFFLHIYI